MNKKVEMGKQYKSSTPDGLFDGVAFKRVLAVDCVSAYPVAVELEDGVILRFTEDGYYYSDRMSYCHNLIEVSPYADFKTDSTWLAEHDAEVRRKVLEEAYKEVDCGITHVRWALEIISRMIEQPDALEDKNV